MSRLIKKASNDDMRSINEIFKSIGIDTARSPRSDYSDTVKAFYVITKESGENPVNIIKDFIADYVSNSQFGIGSWKAMDPIDTQIVDSSGDLVPASLILSITPMGEYRIDQITSDLVGDVQDDQFDTQELEQIIRDEASTYGISTDGYVSDIITELWFELN